MAEGRFERRGGLEHRIGVYKVNVEVAFHSADNHALNNIQNCSYRKVVANNAEEYTTVV